MSITDLYTPELLASIATFSLMLLGFILLIAVPFGLAPKVIKYLFRYSLLVVFAGAIWAYFPLLEEMLRNAKSPSEVALLLGVAFVLLMIFLSFIFGSRFTGQVVASLVAQFVFTTLKLFVKFFYGGFNLLLKPLFLRWRL